MRIIPVKQTIRKTCRKKRAIILAITGLLIIGSFYLGISFNRDESNNSNTLDTKKSFNKAKYPTDESASLWAVVNKGRSLPPSYVPSKLVVPKIKLRTPNDPSEMQLRQDTTTALEKLFKAASANNLELMLASGYRSYSYQEGLYSGYVNSLGQDKTNITSARPGHSEHQTGLAADIEPASRKCEVEACFANTPEGQWLAGNAHKFGFIIRYSAGAENLTGYEYEPWHLRYVGIELAKQIFGSKQTMEQFFGLPPFPDYPEQITVLAD